MAISEKTATSSQAFRNRMTSISTSVTSSRSNATGNRSPSTSIFNASRCSDCSRPLTLMIGFAAVCAVPLLFAATIWAEGRITGKEGAAIRMAMEKHVEEMIEMNGNGKYSVFDPELRQLVQLKLIRFHKGVEAKKGEVPYFLAHADFMAEDGMVYDLDFVISKDYAVISILVHAKDGVEALYDMHHPDH